MSLSDSQVLQADMPVVGSRYLYPLLRVRCSGGGAKEPISAPTMSDSEWSAFLSEARRHRVEPLIYTVVREADLVPERVEETLRSAYYGTLARNLVLFDTLERALASLMDAGIDVVLLKGAALIQSVYGDPALRVMDDLDLLVRHRDARKAIDVLVEGGFERWSAELCPGYMVDFGDQVALRHREPRRGTIDLKWYLLNPLTWQPQLSLDWFWASTSLVQVGDAEARVFDPEAQVIHLCCHIWKHRLRGEYRLAWLHDIAETLTRHRERIDWDDLLLQARKQGLLESVWQALKLVRHGWRPPMPEPVARWLEGPTSLSAQVAGADYQPVRQRRFSVAHVKGVRARVRAGWYKLFPSAGYMRRKYGHGFWTVPVGYLTRLLQIVRRDNSAV